MMPHMIHKRIVRYGEYTSKEERDKYSRDLRGTHFSLGNDPDNGITSYVYDYRRFGPETTRPDKDGVSVRELAKKDFVLGTDRIDPNTSYKIDYPPKQVDAAGLNKDVLKDLRATHYNLGSDPNIYQTIHKQDYVDQGLGKRDPIDKKIGMQNFKLGDAPLNYETTTADTYKRHPLPGPAEKNLGQDIRQAHFVLGNDPKDYCTTTGLQLAHGRFPQPASARVPNVNLKESHIPMGGPGVTPDTIYRTTYLRHPLDKAADNKNLARDLRNAHFTLGDDTDTGIPEYKAAYVKKAVIPNAIDEACAKDIRNSHIDYLFDPNNGQNYLTTYQERIGDNAGRGGPQVKAKTNLHRSNFLFGDEAPAFLTEMKAKYVDHGRGDGLANDFGKRPDTDGLLGIAQGKGEYMTEHRARYTGPKPDLQSLGTAKELSKDLRKAHFVLGNEEGDLTTYYHLDYNKQKKSSEAGKINLNFMNDIKKSHFYFNDKPEIGITHYTDQHRWLQPILKVPEELEKQAGYLK